jgi:large subunit ribosomal protein L30
MASASEATIKVTQFRSSIGSKPKHKGTLRALGLGRVGKSHVLPDRPEIRGMLASVPHLVSFDVVEGDSHASGAAERPDAESGENS